MSIGEQIKRLRLAKNMTQSELAGDQVSRNMLSLIENGRATPSLETLEALASKLKVSPAFLLSEGEEKSALVKSAHLADIRLAFSGRNYRICADLCRRLYDESGVPDHEVDLILSESLFENARDALFSDRVREACRLFDKAVYYATRTAYYTQHLLAAVGMYFDYLEMLSPSLVSENLEPDAAPSALGGFVGDAFCRYIFALTHEEHVFETRADDPAWADLLAVHIRARRNMSDGDYEAAGRELNDILRGEGVLPGIMMYHVFGDMEECCHRSGNSRSAGMYRELRISQFEKLMS